VPKNKIKKREREERKEEKEERKKNKEKERALCHRDLVKLIQL